MSSDVPWITFPGATSGGYYRIPPSVPFTVQANPDASPRVGHVIVNYGAVSSSLTVTQNGSACSFSISPQTVSVPAAGGSAAFSVAASPAACIPIFDYDPYWSIGPHGTSPNYTVSVPANTGGARTAHLAIVGADGQDVAPFTVTQPGPLPVALNCSQATGGKAVGSPYQTVYCDATGDSPPFHWSITGGALPAGVSLGPATGQATTVAGTLTSSGPFLYQVQVTDSALPPRSVSKTFQGAVGPPLQIACPGADTPVSAGSTYSVSCGVSGGVAPYTWSAAGGLSIAGNGESAIASAIATSPGFFHLLGVRHRRERPTGQCEDQPDCPSHAALAGQLRTAGS